MLSVTNRPFMLNVQKLRGDNLDVAWDKFSTLGLPVFVMNEIAWHKQTSQHLGPGPNVMKLFPFAFTKF
jgi:hypothetical protein